MPNKHYEATLPANYREVLVIDAASKKLGILLNVAALVLTVAAFAVCFLLLPPIDYADLLENGLALRYLVFMVSMLLYMVLHELVHGAAYKLLTGHKLTFGLKLTCAYCGVPDIYVYRKAALIALLAPFTVFNLVFLLAAVLLHAPADKLVAVLLFAVHFGGCAGDLYDTFLYLTRLKNPLTLMNDTGPKQTFYVPE